MKKDREAGGKKGMKRDEKEVEGRKDDRRGGRNDFSQDERGYYLG